MTSTKQAAASPSPADIAAAAGVAPEALALLHPQATVRTFVGALLGAPRFPDAVRVVAYALPRREGVWWALLCALEAAGDAPPAAVQASLDATERWVRHPDDHQRRAAMAAAETATFATPAGCAGLAAFLSGGSLSVPGQPDVPPGPFMASKAVFGAVTLAALGGDPEAASERFRRYIEQGLHIGEQAGAWRAGGAT
jgi:hypothetical protein